jgi:hypothetical protein
LHIPVLDMIPSAAGTPKHNHHSIVVLDWPQREQQDIECYCIPSSNLEDHDYIFQDDEEDDIVVKDADENPIEGLDRVRKGGAAATTDTKKTSSTKNRFPSIKWNRFLRTSSKKLKSVAGKDSINDTKPPATEEILKQFISSQDDLDWSAAPMKEKKWQMPKAPIPQLQTTATNEKQIALKSRSSILHPLVEIYIGESRDDIDDSMSVMSSDSCWYDERHGVVELILPNVLYYDEERDDIDTGDENRDDDNFHLLFPSYIEECMESTRGGKEPAPSTRQQASISESGSGDRECCDEREGHDPVHEEEEHDERELGTIRQPEEREPDNEECLRPTNAQITSPSESQADKFDHLVHPEKLSSSAFTPFRDPDRACRRNSVTRYSLDLPSPALSTGSISRPKDEEHTEQASKSHNCNSGDMNKWGNWSKPFCNTHVPVDDDGDGEGLFSRFWKLFELPAFLRRKDETEALSSASSYAADLGDSLSLESLDEWEIAANTIDSTIDSNKNLSSEVGLVGRDAAGDRGIHWWEYESKIGGNVPRPYFDFALADNVTEVEGDGGGDDDDDGAASTEGSCTSATTVMLVETTTNLFECFPNNVLTPDSIDNDMRDDVQMDRPTNDEGIEVEATLLPRVDDEVVAQTTTQTNAKSLFIPTSDAIGSSTVSDAGVTEKNVGNKQNKIEQRDGHTNIIPATTTMDSECRNKIPAVTLSKTTDIIKGTEIATDADRKMAMKNGDIDYESSQRSSHILADPFMAAKEGDLDALQRWGAAHPDHDWKEVDASGNTALYYGCLLGAARNLAIIEYLLKQWPLAQIPPATLQRCKACAVNHSVVQLLEQSDRSEEIALNSRCDQVLVVEIDDIRDVDEEDEEITEMRKWLLYDVPEGEEGSEDYEAEEQ